MLSFGIGDLVETLEVLERFGINKAVLTLQRNTPVR